MNHRQTQTIKLEATAEQATAWKQKAQAIGLSRNDYLLNLLSRRDRFPSSKTFSFLENSSCPGER